MMKREVPVYFITGFLESGKTQFLDFTIHQDYFQIPEKTLLIVCEEGEEEYKDDLEKFNTVMEVIEEPEDFNEDTLRMLDKKHKPGRVIIEFNPLWSADRFYKMSLPRYWDMAQHIVCVDASTFQIYMNNMKSLFVEMIRGADMVIFNRCNRETDPLANFRRSVKVVNAGAEVLFEDEEGEIEDIFQDAMPYDMDADVIEIDDIDYGIWYVDMMDNLDDYVDKTVKFKGQVLKSRDLNAGFFVPGRMAMTCCADDTQFIGYVCKNPEAKRLRMGSWVEVTAKIKKEYMDVYGDEGPVLYASKITPAEKPEQEMVYFT